ncbi:hypothetical protein ABEW32_17370 [Paenibacillus jamilae]|uniref:hypothetical protein n=1 Tax=Paenibacillus jamilae TaxID=114136 RepID=UPI003D28C345
MPLVPSGTYTGLFTVEKVYQMDKFFLHSQTYHIEEVEFVLINSRVVEGKELIPIAD